jgi:hypothetical protein
MSAKVSSPHNVAKNQLKMAYFFLFIQKLGYLFGKY